MFIEFITVMEDQIKNVYFFQIIIENLKEKSNFISIKLVAPHNFIKVWTDIAVLLYYLAFTKREAIFYFVRLN